MVMSGKEHLEWAAERALEYFDSGDQQNAMASFISDVGKHPGTAWIQGEHLLLMLMPLEMSSGRESLRRYLLGFAVSE